MTHNIIKSLAAIAFGAMLLGLPASKVCTPERKCN